MGRNGEYMHRVEFQHFLPKSKLKSFGYHDVISYVYTRHDATAVIGATECEAVSDGAVSVANYFGAVSDTTKLTGPWTLADKRWVGPVKLLCITMFDISKIGPKSILGLAKTKKFSRCLLFRLRPFRSEAVLTSYRYHMPARGCQARCGLHILRWLHLVYLAISSSWLSWRYKMGTGRISRDTSLWPDSTPNVTDCLGLYENHLQLKDCPTSGFDHFNLRVVSIAKLTFSVMCTCEGQ